MSTSPFPSEPAPAVSQPLLTAPSHPAHSTGRNRDGIWISHPSHHDLPGFGGLDGHRQMTGS
jgi:hypothetical protein